MQSKKGAKPTRHREHKKSLPCILRCRGSGPHQSQKSSSRRKKLLRQQGGKRNNEPSCCNPSDMGGGLAMRLRDASASGYFFSAFFFAPSFLSGKGTNFSTVPLMQ